HALEVGLLCVLGAAGALGGVEDAVGVDLPLEAVEERLPGGRGVRGSVVGVSPPGVGCNLRADGALLRGQGHRNTSELRPNSRRLAQRQSCYAASAAVRWRGRQPTRRELGGLQMA